MRNKVVTRAVAALAGGCVLGTAGLAAAAQQTCMANGQTIGDANTVFITGSSAIEPLLQHLASVLYQEAVVQADGGTPSLGNIVKIVYQSTASCQGVNDITTPMAESASAKFMDGSTGPVATEYGCTMLSGTGSTLTIDIGASDVYPSSCTAMDLPSGFKDFDGGAIQVMEFAVPTASSESSITADAAYVVMGWGGQAPYQVGPWTDYTQIWIRPNGFLASGTEVMIGSAIGLVTTKWLSAIGDAGASQIQSGSGGVYNHLVASTKPDATIGILSAEFLDKNRGAIVLNDAGVAASGGVKPLAFQATGQDCAYYADSSGNTFDKLNVRQGRYAIWGAHHWITNVDGSGNPVGQNGNTAAVKALIDHLQHALTLPPQSDETMITAEAKTFDVPLCAMQVNRTAEVSTAGSGEMSYLPAKGCGCYFESVINNGSPVSSYCQPCGGADAGACPSAYPACNYGFCEVQ